MASNNYSNDVDVDAQPEEDVSFSPSDDDAVVDMNVLKGPNTQQPPAVSRDARTTDKAHKANDYDFDYFKPMFPPELREDNIDFLIIPTDHDYQEALTLKKYIEDKVKLDDNEIPNVVLMQDVHTDLKCNQIDYAYSKSIYIVMYVTEKFCSDWVKISESYSLFLNCIENPEEGKAIIRIYTCKELGTNVKLPSFFLNAMSLNNFDKTFIEKISVTINHKSDLRWQRKIRLDQERFEFFIVKYAEMMQYKNIKKQGNKSATSKSESVNNEIPQSTSLKEPEVDREANVEIEQQLGQFSISTEQKSGNALEDETTGTDEAVSGDRMQPQENSGLDGDRMQPQENSGLDGDRMQPQENSGLDSSLDQTFPKSIDSAFYSEEGSTANPMLE